MQPRKALGARATMKTNFWAYQNSRTRFLTRPPKWESQTHFNQNLKFRELSTEIDKGRVCLISSREGVEEVRKQAQFQLLNDIDRHKSSINRICTLISPIIIRVALALCHHSANSNSTITHRHLPNTSTISSSNNNSSLDLLEFNSKWLNLRAKTTFSPSLDRVVAGLPSETPLEM